MHIYHGYVELPTINCLNMLGLGSGISYVYKNYNNRKYITTLFEMSGKLFCFFFMVLILIYFNNSNSPNLIFFNELVLMLVCGFLVIATINKWTFIGKFILEFYPVRYLGKISYGLYVFHMPMPSFVNILENRLRFIFINDPYIKLLFLLSLSILISHISYYYFESKFLSLKKYFD
jgi:peptidoglycan/LPS O-acetylase OafA/YrhL